MKTIMITGIAGGFGKPTALALLQQGYRVAGSVRSKTGKNAAAVAELEAAGAILIEMDVTDTASTEAGIAAAIAQLGGLDRRGEEGERVGELAHAERAEALRSAPGLSTASAVSTTLRRGLRFAGLSLLASLVRLGHARV